MRTAALAAVQQPAVATRRGRAHLVAQLLSLSPFWILLAVAADPQAQLLAPPQATPLLLGIAADALFGAVTLAWMAVGTLIIRFARSPLAESLALLAFTIPATITAVLVPALVYMLVRAG